MLPVFLLKPLGRPTVLIFKPLYAMRLFVLLLMFTFPLGSFIHAQTGSLTVYLFLLEDCKITQAYTNRLNAIYHTYHAEGIRFEALFSNPVSTDTAITGFIQKYHFEVPCRLDTGGSQARAFGVTVTPEVVLYDERRQQILYQGRIDNLYERVGQRRQVVTSFELEAALFAVTHHKPVPIPRTQAVGCLLPLSKS
jgi:hypothetical protein